jgi:hypothetical protein
MTTTTTAVPERLIKDDKLVELLGLLKGADSVELKLTVDAGAQRAALGAMGLDPLDAQIRMVHFFDTPDLACEQAGVVVRARRTQGKPDDTVVKLRPVVPDTLPARLRDLPEFVVEVDAMESGFVCSGSMKGLAKRPCGPAIAGGTPLRKLYTKEQRAFFADHAPEGIGLDDLRLLGPIFVLKLKGMASGFPRKLVGEMWLYPDGSRILELSTKCAPSEAFQVAAEARAYFAGVGIGLDGDQQTKTKKALEFFAAELVNGDSEAKLPEEKPPVEAAVADDDGDE